MNKQATRSNRGVLQRFSKATFMAGLLPALVLLFGLQSSQAGSATWNLNPTSKFWRTAANWTPNTVPDDPSDVATFDVSNVTTISQEGVNLAEIIFNPGASGFTIHADYPGLNFYGAGITNNSGVVQTFGAVSGLESVMNFYNSATAGEDTILFEAGQTTDDYTYIEFHDTSSAGSATIINYGNRGAGGFGGTYFSDSSTAANATVFNRTSSSSGFTSFSGMSKAGSATFVCETGTGFNYGGQMSFDDDSSAENATITIKGAPPGVLGASVAFNEIFQGTATADNATFIISGGINGGIGGTLSFGHGSLGGTAQVKMSGNGTLDLTGHDPGTVSIGSLAGKGLVLLGTTNLTIGTNNLTTAFAGNISDNVQAPGASLTKTGSGNLTLSAANAYDGGTFVQGRGILFVNNATGSGTGTGAVQINSGVLGGNGIISGPVVLGNGPSAASLMPGKSGRSPAVLTIGQALSFDADATYLWLLDTVREIASSVVAKGVTVDSAALFSPAELQSGTLSAGTVFTVITNNGAAAISGTFSNLPDGGTLTVGSNTFQANYEGGDGNDLTLTVIP